MATIETYREMLKAIPDAEIKEKKAYAAELGISSCKAADLTREVLLRLRDIRKTKTAFDKTDIREFDKLEGYHNTAKYVFPYLEQESIEFVQFLFADTVSIIREKGSKTMMHVIETDFKGNWWKGRYSDLSISQQFIIARAETLFNYLHKEELKPKETSAELTEFVRKILEPFKETWMKMRMDWALGHYEMVQKMYPKYKSDISRIDKVLCDLYNSGHRSLHDKLDNAWCGGSRYTTRENGFLRFHHAKRFVAANAAEFMTEKTAWMSEVKKQLIADWSRCVAKLAKKCEEMDVDINAISITLEPSPTDAGFEVAFTDGKGREVFARLIWAAEYSDLVSPHLRYIVTSRKFK